MKKILYIAPHAFPIRSSESICNAKVAFALAKAGYEVDVYTCDFPSTYPPDKELTEKLSSSENIKIKTISPKYILLKSDPILKLLKSALVNLKILFTTGYFYNGISISYLLYKKIVGDLKLSKKFPYDFIITRGYYTDIVGILLHKMYKFKWIANWNDPFPMKNFPPPYGLGPLTKLPFFENRICKELQKRVDVHTFPNDRLRNYMLECFRFIDKGRTLVIPHMALATLYKEKKIINSKLKFVHTGDLKPPRSPIYFLEALSRYIHNFPMHKNKIECVFVGSVDMDLQYIIKKLSLSDTVKILPGVNYKESLAYVQSSNVALVMEAQCKEGIYLPTKVVDALQSGTPIFAISPETGVLKDLTAMYEIGYYSSNTSVDSIYHTISCIFEDFVNKSLPLINTDSCPIIYDKAIINQYRHLLVE